MEHYKVDFSQVVVLNCFMCQCLCYEQKVLKLDKFYKETLQKHSGMIREVFKDSRFMLNLHLHELQLKLLKVEINNRRFSILSRKLAESLSNTLKDPVLVMKIRLLLA